MRFSLFLSVLCFGWILGVADPGEALAEPDWSSWRGPNGDGHSTDANLPIAWAPENILWKTPLKGEGQSSPCVWGERIFLTRSEGRGAKRFVFCVNRADGQILWEHKVWEGNAEPTHKMNGWASPTCVTDGELVFAFFGKGGLHCFTVNGDRMWSKDLGAFVGPWGTAASPVLYKDLIIQNCDADQNAALIAFNKKTGEQAWKTKREDFRGWSTPVLIETGNRVELALNSHTGVYGYDPATGEQLWYCKGYNGRGSPTVTPGPLGLIYVVNGRPGPVFSVKPGGEGNVTDTHKVWFTKRGGGRDLPSPIVLGGKVLVVNMQGVLTAYDAKTGKEGSKIRLNGQFSAAPIAYKDLAFFVSEDGETVVVKADEKLEIVGRNDINSGDEEIFRSSITPDDGQLLIRSTKMLYCIGKPEADK